MDEKTNRLKNIQKQTFKPFLQVLGLLVFCPGCSGMNLFLPSSNFLSPESVISNFEINDANVGRAPRHESFSGQESWHIEKAEIYQMKLCFENKVDNKTDRNLVIGQRFEVLNEDKTHTFRLSNRGLTDVNGCIHWMEKMKSSYFNQLRPVFFERIIGPVESTTYFGEIRWQFALYLWKKRGPEPHHPKDSFNHPSKFKSLNLSQTNIGSNVVYQTDSDFPSQNIPVVESILVQEDPHLSNASLIVDLRTLEISPVLEPLDSVIGLKLKYQLNLEVLARIYDEFGQFYDLPLDTGVYDISAHLVSSHFIPNTKSQFYCARLSEVREPVEFEITNNLLFAHIEVDWKYALNNENRVFLELEVKPKNLPEGVYLKPVKSYYPFGNYNAVFDDATTPPTHSFDALKCQNNSIYSSHDLSYLSSLKLNIHPMRAWDLIPDLENTFTILNLDFNDESAEIRKLFLESKICFSSDKNLNDEILPSRFELDHITKAHDQRYLLRTFGENETHVLCSQSELEQGTCNETIETVDRCVRIYDRLRYKYYTKSNHSPLVMYKAHTKLFSHYNPILFLKFDLYNIDKYAVNCETRECWNDSQDPLIQALNFTSSDFDAISFSEQSITFKEENKESNSFIEEISPGIDRFLNRKNKYQLNFKIEPTVSIPSHQGPHSSNEKLRSGIYLLRAISLKRTPKFPHFPWIGFRVNHDNDSAIVNLNQGVNQSELEEKEELMSSASDFIYLDGEEDIMKASLPLLMKELNLTNIRQHLFFQYKVLNEKKMILIHLISKIYGLQLHQNDNQAVSHPLLDCFSKKECGSLNDASWLNGSPKREEFLRDYEKPSTSEEFSSLIQAINNAKITICYPLNSLSSSELSVCEKKIELLSSFLDEISKTYTPDSSSRDNQFFNSFFHHYTYFCKSPLYQGQGNCPQSHQMNELKNTLKSALGFNNAFNSMNGSSHHSHFSLTRNYSLIDNFEKTRSVLKIYLDLKSPDLEPPESLSSEILNAISELTKHLSSETKEKILLLFLKIIHSSSSFLSQIDTHHRSSKISAEPIIKSTQNLLAAAKKLDWSVYEKIGTALFKNSSLNSPVSWTPILFSGSQLMQEKRYPVYKLSALKQEFSSKRKNNASSMEPVLQMSEVEEEVRYYEIFQNCKTCKRCETCRQVNASGGVCESACQSCDPNTSTEYRDCNEDQKDSPSYMDYLFKRKKRSDQMKSLAMCYGMIKPLLSFKMKYVSLEEAEFLDPFCKDLLLNAMVRISKTPFRDLEFDIETILQKTLVEKCDISFLSETSSSNQRKEAFEACLNEKIFHERVWSITPAHRTAHRTPEKLSPLNSFLYQLKHPEVMNPVFTVHTASPQIEDLKMDLNKEFERLKKMNPSSLFSLLLRMYPHWKNSLPSENSLELSLPVEDPLDFAQQVPGEKLKTLIQNFNGQNNSISWDASWNANDHNIFLNLCFYLASRFNDEDSTFNALHIRVDSIKCFLALWYLSLSENRKNNLLDRVNRLNFAPFEFPFIIEKQYRVFEARPKTNANTQIDQKGDASDLQLWPFQNLESSTTLSSNIVYGFKKGNLDPLIKSIPILEAHSMGRINDAFLNARTNRLLEFTHLRLERLKTKIELKKYQECLVFYRNPKYYAPLQPSFDASNALSFDLEWHLNLLDALTLIEIGNPRRGSPESLSSILRDFHLKKGGISICSRGEKLNKEIEEQYFYIENKFNPPTLLDNTDRRNHPWSLSIRGLNPLSALFRILMSDYYVNQIFQNPSRDDRQIGESTVLRLARAYRTFALFSYLVSPQGLYKEESSDSSSNFQDWWKEIKTRPGTDPLTESFGLYLSIGDEGVQ